MTQVILDIPPEKLGEFNTAMDACNRFHVDKGELIADAVKEVFVSGEWSKYVKQVNQ